MTRELIIECMTCKDKCEEEDSCLECAKKQLAEYENQIRAEERTKVLEEVLKKHNNCNTDLCEYADTNISCCECIVRKLKEQKNETLCR